MKRTITLSLMILAVSLAAFAQKVIDTGKTYTPVGDYKIEVAEKPFILNDRVLTSYIISYENTPLKVTVAIDNHGRQINYITMSDKLSVQYTCTDKSFGVEKLNKKYAENGIFTSEEVLNRAEYLNQRVIHNGENTPLENVKLIAAFFPPLIKDIDSILTKR